MRKLEIAISTAELNAIKADARRFYPEIKSSHRCEAIARGLGFKTYASLLYSVRSPRTAELRAGDFRDYLLEHGFDVSEVDFYRVLARSALRMVAAAMPELNSSGYGYGSPRRRADGRSETWDEEQARFRDYRADLLDSTDEFLRAYSFLENIPKTQTIRPKTSSYWIKHIAEKYLCQYPDGSSLGPDYVSNGAVIAAALHLGFRWRNYPDGWGYPSLNVGFNMSQRALNTMHQQFHK